MLFEAVLTTLMVSVPGQMPNANQAPQAGQIPLHAVETQLIKHTNEERVRHGLEPLQTDGALAQSAREHAFWMARNQNLQHTSKPVGENIALGQRSVREALHSWMHSSGHRANILSRRYRRMGASAFVARDGRIYWCQQFR